MKLKVKSNLLDLRTIIIIVSTITTLSVIYNTVINQIILIFISLVLLFTIDPSKHRMKRIIHRLKMILRIILTLMIFQVLFRHGGEILWQFGIVKITSLGIQYGLTSSLRIMLITIIAGLLLDVPYYDYIIAFRSWKIPYEISFLVATVIHFIPIFHKQFIISKEALNLRGIEFSSLPLKRRFKLFMEVVFPVIAKAISEVKYRSISLELRAFRLYPKRTYIYKRKLKFYEIIIQIIIFSSFTLLIFFNLTNKL